MRKSNTYDVKESYRVINLIQALLPESRSRSRETPLIVFLLRYGYALRQLYKRLIYQNVDYTFPFQFRNPTNIINKAS